MRVTSKTSKDVFNKKVKAFATFGKSIQNMPEVEGFEM